MIIEHTFVGTKLKFAISISSPGFNMTEDDFTVDIRRGAKTIHFDKEDLVVDENDQYYVCFDTAELGGGVVEAIITAFVPDDDFSDGIRTEVAKITLLSVYRV